MGTVFDHLAYRLFSRPWSQGPSPYTPEYHYRMRAKMHESYPHLMVHSDLRFSYCTAIVRMRLVDLYWSVRGFLEK